MEGCALLEERICLLVLLGAQSIGVDLAEHDECVLFASEESWEAVVLVGTRSTEGRIL